MVEGVFEQHHDKERHVSLLKVVRDGGSLGVIPRRCWLNVFKMVFEFSEEI